MTRRARIGGLAWAAALAFGCGTGGSGGDLDPLPGTDLPAEVDATPDNAPEAVPDAEVPEEAFAEAIEEAIEEAANPDLPPDTPDAAADTPDTAPDTATDATPDTATDTTLADGSDAAPDAPTFDADAPPLPRDIPFVTPPFAAPVVDSPYLQEFNHTSNEVEPGIGPLVAVLLPPSTLPTYEAPTQVTPRGLVTHDAGGILRLLAIPEGDRDLVGAAFLPDGILLAGPQRLYTRVGDALVSHELPQAPQDAGDLVAVDPGNGRVFLRAVGPRVGILSSVDPATWPATIAWAPWPGVTAIIETADAVFVASWNPIEPPQAFVTAVAPYQFADPLPDYIDPLMPPAIGLATGPVRALVANVTRPDSLDLVAIGDSGLAGLRFEGGVFTPVDVPLFAADRVPLDQPTTAARTSDGGFVVATKGGAYRLRDVGLGPEWHVYNRGRWLPDDEVRSVATDATLADAPLFFATPGGLASVTAARMTLQQKMAGIIDRILLRHDRDGAVADSRLSTPGDLSTSIPWDSDNDGGWTCYWLLAECFRYKATGDPAAKAHFDKSLDRMLSFRTLTGTDWFVARSVIRKSTCNLDDCDNPDDGEWFTSPDGEWWVKSDTSNDEVTSHMFMMGHAYDLCADEDQKARIADHVSGIVGGLVDHGYKLLKPDGVETTYGQFDPEYVNGIVGIMADGGRRSVQMLAALDLALYMTNDPKFDHARRYLIDEHHYDENVVTESEAPARRGSGDGDELAMQAFFVLLRYETDPLLYAKYLEGWHRTYANIRLQEAALWDVINGVLGGEAPSFDNGLRWLRLVPVDGIRWPQHNVHRRDLAPPPEYYRRTSEVRWARSDGHPLPVDERPSIRHNTSQYEVEGGWGANTEIDGADVLAAYWMARWHGFLVPEAP